MIGSARVGLTGAASSPIRLANVESALSGQPASSETAASAARFGGAGIDDLNSDIHASAEYRRAMIPVFTRRALDGALARVAG